MLTLMMVALMTIVGSAQSRVYYTTEISPEALVKKSHSAQHGTCKDTY